MRKDLVSDWDQEESLVSESVMVSCPICMGIGKLLIQPRVLKYVQCPTCVSSGLVSEALLQICINSQPKLSL